MLRWLFIGVLVLSFFVTGWNGFYFSVYTGVMGAMLNGVLMLLGYAIVRAVVSPFRRKRSEEEPPLSKQESLIKE